MTSSPASPAGPPGSFRDYWRTQSRGTFDPVPFLAEPLVFSECPLPDRTPARDLFGWQRGETTEADAAVRRIAVIALGETKSDAAIPILKRVIETDTDIRVRRMAIGALGEIGSEAAEKALVEVIEKGLDTR